MTSKKLYASVTGVNSNEKLSISVSDGHDAAVATAIIQCVDHSLQIGDQITVDIGYTTDHGHVFKGYVKQIEQGIAPNTWTITAHNVMTRAVDYFIASSDPDHPATWTNVAAETLVGDLLGMAGLHSYTCDSTYFTLGVINPVEINLISSYDAAKSIANLVAWEIWADNNGLCHFENRKPFPMKGGESQPGWHNDTSIGTKTDASILSLVDKLHEKDLRNRVVVYGAEGIHADVSSSTSYNPKTGHNESVLPAGYYKTAVAASQWIDTQEMANDAASYNLHLLNRLTEEMAVTILGDHNYFPRKTMRITSVTADINAEMYIYFAEHNWSQNGYIVNLELRR